MERYAWILEEELGVWNLEIGIPDLSAVIVAPHFGIGIWNWKRPGFKCKDCGCALLEWNFGILELELGIGRTAARTGTTARRGASPQWWPTISVAIGRRSKPAGTGPATGMGPPA